NGASATPHARPPSRLARRYPLLTPLPAQRLPSEEKCARQFIDEANPNSNVPSSQDSTSRPILGGVKRLTREQVESRKEKAVRFTDNVLGDPDRADEIADESPESYAERKGIEITNPNIRRKTVARIRTKAELEAEIEELQQENQELQDQLDAVADIV